MKAGNLTSLENSTGDMFTTFNTTSSSESGSLTEIHEDPSSIINDIFNSNSSVRKPLVMNILKSVPKVTKSQKRGSNFSHLQYRHPVLSPGRSSVEKHISPGDTVRLNKGETNASNIVNRHCENNAQCGLWAECVQLTADQPRQCWCVNDLERPDPQTGGCGGTRSSGNQHSVTSHGVILPDHLKDIVLTGIGNVTSARATNETSSTLLSQTVGASSDVSLLQIIPPVAGSFMLIAILLVISLMCRRRYVNKHFSATRNGDMIVKNSDGTGLLDRMNNISKNPTYFCPNNGSTKRQHVREVASEHLKLLEVVGEGAFGQVFRGKLYVPETESEKQVAIKVLKDGASREAREDFDREVEIMASFDHDNILKLLCVIVQETHGNPYMIFEYMEHGDLAELLRKNDPHLRDPTGKFVTLNKTDLVDASVQIASGMSYLTTQRFVHRDLATRNCLVGNGLIVKISDFGMSRDVYTTDYYRIGGSRMLPVRWMSPEAIKYGRFTSESDIWAYGVVLWEIFSCGRQPYCGHTNEEVIQLLDQGILLQRPEDCPSTVYHVMLGCWKKDPKERLLFERLLKYLKEYRNRLIKPPHIHQQQHLSSAAEVSTVLQGSDIRKLHLVQGKVDTVDSCLQIEPGCVAANSGSSLKYLTLADTRTISDVKCVPDDDKNSDFGKRQCATEVSDTSNVHKSSNEVILKAKHSSDDLTRYDKQSEQYAEKRNSFPNSPSCPTQESSHHLTTTVINEYRTTDAKKPQAKRMASYPLFNDNQIVDDRTKGQMKRSFKCGSGGRSSFKYHSDLSQNKKNSGSLPESALELCLGLNSISQGYPVSTNNSSKKAGHSPHTLCGNIHHKTNKVKDKSGFSETNWNLKSQSSGISEDSTYRRFDEGLDTRSAFMQNQREISVVNEYSVPGKFKL